MKKIVCLLCIVCSSLSAAQDTSFDKDFFQNKRLELSLQKQNFVEIATSIQLNQNQNDPLSIVLMKPSSSKSQYTYSQLKLNIKKVPEMIDYANQMQCGPLQPRNAKGMMISTIKNYLINKYIFGSFVKTTYNWSKSEKSL